MKKLLLLLTMLVLSIEMQAQGTSWSNATLVKDGETVSGTMDETNMDAWFKIELTKEGNVTLMPSPMRIWFSGISVLISRTLKVPITMR